MKLVGPKLPVSAIELRGHVYDFYRNEGYFPLALKASKVLRLKAQPIWRDEGGRIPLCIFHHPDLVMWPAVTLLCDISRRLLVFEVDHWKSKQWCEAQSIYTFDLNRPRIAHSMIHDDPMIYANLGC